MTEGLLDNHPPPLSVTLTREPDCAQVPGNEGKELRSSREVVEVITSRPVFFIDLREQALQLLISVVVLKVSRQVI